MTPHDLVVSASWILPIAGPPLEDGWMAIDEGVISDLGTGPPPAAAQKFSYDRHVLYPGFVNAHTHLGCSFLKGLIPPLEFMSWFTDEVGPRVKDAYLSECGPPSRDVLEKATLAAIQGQRRVGVVGVFDSFFSSIGARAMSATNMKGVFAREFFGSSSDDLDAYIRTMRDQVAEDLERFSEIGIGYALAPHSLYACPRDVLLAAFAEAHRHKLSVTLHLAESQEEFEFFTNGSGPLKDLVAPGEKKNRYTLGKTPVGVLNELGLLGPNLTLVHMNHVTDEDLDLVAESGASVVHCPCSNANLATGIAPVAKMLQRGIPVGLGTDSYASNRALDPVGEMRMAQALHRASTQNVRDLSAATLLRASTWTAASITGLANVGSLAPGLSADFVVDQHSEVEIEMSRLRGDPERLVVEYDPSERRVFVGGKKVER